MNKLPKILLFFTVIAAAAALLAAENTQKVFPIDSDVHTALTYISMEQGKSIPSSSGPWTEGELKAMLQRINRATLSPSGRRVYDYAAEKLSEEPNIPFLSSAEASVGLTAALELYLHTNTASSGFFTEESDWVYDYEARNPLVSIPIEGWVGENLYGFSEISIMKNQFLNPETTADIFNHPVSTSLFFLPPSQAAYLNTNAPYRAFASVGGESWNIQLGRDRLRWGSGTTGNLLIGGHLQYQDFFRFTAFAPALKYTSLLVSFPHPLSYGYASPFDDEEAEDPAADSPLKGVRFFSAHRIEVRILDVLNIIASSGLMYLSEDGTIDLNLFNPLKPAFDSAMRANANAAAAVEFELNPWENLNVYGQLLIDEIRFPWEPAPGAGLPGAVGFLSGIQGILPHNNGMLYGGFEAAYTDPYLYLNGTGFSAQEADDYGINYVVAIREHISSGEIGISEDFLGYEYGNDTLLFSLSGGYREFGRLHFGGNFTYLLQGTQGMDTLWDITQEAQEAIAPTTTPASDDHGGTAGGNAVEHSLILGLHGSYQPSSSLTWYGRADLIYLIHPDNLRENPPAADFQVSLGAAWHLQ